MQEGSWRLFAAALLSATRGASRSPRALILRWNAPWQCVNSAACDDRYLRRHLRSGAYAHVILARAAIELLDLDKIIFVSGGALAA
jgi:hypothetical protein